jgi:hypothetical protein
MDKEQKIQDKDLPNVKHLAMQEGLQKATSFGISIHGDNTRKCVGGGPASSQTKVTWACKGEA